MKAIGAKNTLLIGVYLSVALMASYESGYADGEPSNSKGCRIGEKTGLALSCGNAWVGRNGNSFMPWEDQNNAIQVVHSVSCHSLTLLEVRPAVSLAKARCEGSSDSVWINLEHLECHPQNLRREAAKRASLMNNRFCEDCQDAEGAAPNVATEFIEEVTGHALLNAAKDRYHQIYRQALKDHWEIGSRYAGMPSSGLRHRIEGARAVLKLRVAYAHSRFGAMCDKGEGSDAIRGKRTCALLSDAYDKSEQLLSTLQSENGEKEAVSLVDRVSMPDNVNYEGLIERTVLFYGLPPWIQSKLAKSNEHFVRESPISELPGTYELHNGYVFGGSRLGSNSGNGIDCSDFITELLMSGGSRRKRIGRPSAADFFRVAEVRRSIEENLPEWGIKAEFALDEERGATAFARDEVRSATGSGLLTKVRSYGRRLKKTVVQIPEHWSRNGWSGLPSCFDTVQLQQGQEPRPGDIVVEVDPVFGDGHVVLVQSYDSQAKQITTWEAVGGKDGRVKQMRREIFEPSCFSGFASSDYRALRPDLRVLRLKADPPKGCPLDL